MTNISINEYNNSTNNSIIFYPNPTTGMLSWNSDFQIKWIKIYSQSGSLLCKIENIDSNTIYLQNLKDGVYIITCGNENIIYRDKILFLRK